MLTSTKRTLAVGFAVTLALASAGAASANGARAGTDLRPSVFMPLRGAAHGSRPTRGGSNNLSFHGGNPGVVKGADTVYLVFWGSQWTSNDPSGEAALLGSFFGDVGGSNWNNSVTQYCDGVAFGTITCGTSGNHPTNPGSINGGS